MQGTRSAWQLTNLQGERGSHGLQEQVRAVKT